jgi:hypothetical protein
MWLRLKGLLCTCVCCDTRVGCDGGRTAARDVGGVGRAGPPTNPGWACVQLWVLCSCKGRLCASNWGAMHLGAQIWGLGAARLTLPASWVGLPGIGSSLSCSPGTPLAVPTPTGVSRHGRQAGRLPSGSSTALCAAGPWRRGSCVCGLTKAMHEWHQLGSEYYSVGNSDGGHLL